MIIEYLKSRGGTPGSGSSTTNLIEADNSRNLQVVSVNDVGSIDLSNFYAPYHRYGHINQYKGDWPERLDESSD